MISPKNCRILPVIAVITAFLGLFSALPSAFAQNADNSPAAIDKLAQITVEANGSVSVKPDMALLQISVSHEAKTAKNAAEETAATLQTVLTAMKKQDIDDKDIQSNGLVVNTIYPQDNTKAKREKTFQAIATLNLKIRDTRKLGSVIDAAIASGATGLSDVTWTNSDLKPLYAAARQQAVGNALEKIKTYAQAAGVTAGRILKIEEISNDPAPRFYARARSSLATAADVPVAEGEEIYTVRITLTQELVHQGL